MIRVFRTFHVNGILHCVAFGSGFSPPAGISEVPLCCSMHRNFTSSYGRVSFCCMAVIPQFVHPLTRVNLQVRLRGHTGAMVLRHFQTGLHSSGTFKHSCWQCIRSLNMPHFCQHLLFSIKNYY
ncbi:hypothetical protein HJG60_009672 [Phyllostomus discolor]|uniref:Uncharacterized protein n=1 Tax=Phyllostomus discolor TaxID=89673 RepID=A0A834B2B2_9CHIR|nr:hypothetical protein HJG60_009672 [Phyllostomus discolor]